MPRAAAARPAERAAAGSRPVPRLSVGHRVTTTPELADRIATEMGWLGLAFAFAVAATPRASSLVGWLDDIGAAVSYVQRELRPLGVWLAGFGTGGALSVCAARDPGSRAWRRWGRRATSTTGPVIPATCSSTARSG